MAAKWPSRSLLAAARQDRRRSLLSDARSPFMPLAGTAAPGRGRPDHCDAVRELAMEKIADLVDLQTMHAGLARLVET